MSIETEGNIPFAYQPGEVIGTGRESVVKELGPDWVIKEVNPLNEHGTQRKQETVDWFRNPERVQKLSKEQESLENIFGKEHFLRAYFVYGEDQTGKVGYMMVQKRIEGTPVRDLIGEEYESQKEMIYRNREQFMEIVWGTKKAFVELGVPIDFHDGNMIRETSTGRIVLIDCGFPSEESNVVFSDRNSERKPNSLTRAYQRIDRIKLYESYLELTEQEKQALDTKYALTDEAVQAQIQKLDSVRESLGISAGQIEAERRKDTVDGFLDVVFGEKEQVTGNEIRAFALQVIGVGEINKRTQRILDELEKQGDSPQNRDYWKKLIEG